MREEKKNDKIIAIYHAIEELAAEGADISTMRVSDIAARAGIGKGTTYEYFSSKEEMVVKAMTYLVGSMVKHVLNQMEKLDSFQDKFLLLLDEMEEKVKQRACILKYLNMLNDMNLCQQMRDILHEDTDDKNANPMRIIRYLLEQGQKEGRIGKKYSQAYMETTVFSRVLSFVMYVNHDLGTKDCSNEKMKQELYSGLCRELSA